ncbi:alpha-2-macroglobulin family protein [uncultured Thiothrix sp.]|uniref:alpha-2-macroglobulin family protein n=1 Tax=uncultured Thiothrix sp. TaxID=223185 RepID=UPI002631B75D|nr:alpha-2-macroglobulin family protein [uncultured Thiothrix sp.]HMT94084.1 alpha-2-macroglobulin family protein [Thiolinea sp.]
MSLLQKINFMAICIVMSINPVIAAELEPIQGTPALTEFPARISEDSSRASKPADAMIVVQPQALSAEETKTLLGRLPPLPITEDEKPFALRPASEPPPKVGVTLEQSFPPSPNTSSIPPSTKTGSLSITRYAPQGEVPVAQQISISFDRPMVAVSTQTQTLVESVPVKMTPTVEGAWRWAGTQTLVFEAKGGVRLPMATEFKLSVPADTQAADGSRLGQALAWSFKTPSLKLEQSYPSGDAVALTPILFLSFNQRINPQALLSYIQAEAKGQPLKLRLAAADEIKAVPELDSLIKQALPEQYLVLKLEQVLPPQTQVIVKLAAQAPSAEGSRLAPAQNLYSFSTYAPLRMTEKACGYAERCTRYDPVSFQFNNELAPEQDLNQLISISPKPTKVSMQANANGLWIQAPWQADTSYTITLAAELRDSYGQILGRPQKFSFKASKSPASLSLIDKTLLTLDPNLPAELPVYTNNFKTLKVTIQQVAPSDWPSYIKLLQALNSRQAPAPFKLPGKTVSSQTLTLQEQTDTTVVTPIKLESWLKNGKLGHLLVLIEPGEASVKPRAIDGEPQPRLVWVQGTQMGLDAYAYSRQLLVWVGDLNTGKALDQVRLSLHSSASKEISQQAADPQGLAKLDYLQNPPNPETVLPVTEPEPTIRWLEAQHGEDLALLPESEYLWAANSWQPTPASTQWLWYVVDDRHLYRPNEQVHIKGWLRSRDASPASPLTLPKNLKRLNYEVLDSAGNKIAEGKAPFTGLGGFNLDFKLPDTPNLGAATLSLTVPDQPEMIAYNHSFEIQEFRTPEFEVKTELINPEPYLGNTAIHLAANANYYAGGGLAAAPVNWRLNASLQAYTPPNRDEWAFGLVQPYWLRVWMPPSTTVSADFQGKTDQAGRQQLLIQPELSKYPLPVSMAAEARVSDVNRQEWVSSSTWLIHPSEVYVGLKTDSYFVEHNQPLSIQIITTDIEGKVLANTPIVVELGIADLTKDANGAVLKNPQRCMVQSDTKGLAQCEFKLEEAGQYQITATTMDQSGRRNMTRITRWVSGETEVETPTASTVEAQQLPIIADKEIYAPNETAKLLIQAPFKDAEGLLLMNHNGLLSEQRFNIQGNSHILELPLKAEWLPNVQVHIELTGKTARFTTDKTQSLPERPAFATGNLNLKISKAERVLKVEVTPEKDTLAPAEETPIHLSIQNQQGQAVANAEVALIVVDEAILAAGNYQLTDPLEIFYPLAEAYLQPQALRTSVLVPNLAELSKDKSDVFMQGEQANLGGAARVAAFIVQPRAVMRSRIAAEASKMVMYAAADAAASPEPKTAGAINLRTNFNPLAVFVPNLQTDANGKVSTTIKLPDNLTRYRIMAIAAQDAIYYGKGESHLTARKPLMVRPSAPRFLNYGDSFEFPVVLQNQTDQALPVKVALGASNLELTAAQAYAFELPANQRVEVRFPTKTLQAGQAHYQIAAIANDLSDAAMGSLPVWTPATTEAFATYGVLDRGAISQPLATPKAVIPAFGQLEISTSSTALQSLTDAYLYLQGYPFSCSEQVASRVLSTSALKDVLQAFKTKDLPDPEAIQQSMQRDLALLVQRQTPEGGFSLWERGQDWPYVTAHTVHALLRAKAKGYTVNEQALEMGLNYLRQLEQYFPDDYSKEVRHYIKAYSLYVRELGGDQDRAAVSSLITQAGGVSQLPSEALGWLLAVLANDTTATQQRQTLIRELMNRSTETASGAAIKAELNTGGYWVMHSERAVNGIALEALIKAQPKSDLIPKLVKALQSKRTQGHWGSTQDNVFVLLGLDQYFQTYESQTPDFVAKAWLGTDFAGEYRFKGRSTESMQTEIPMEWLLKGEARRDLVLAKEGEGRLYYRLGLNYAPQDLELQPAEHGFTVTRHYRGLDKPEDVKQHADGSWQIKVGSRVEVTLMMQANAERYHVALVDPLPAGLEAVNPALAVSSQQIPENPELAPIPFSWRGSWYEQQNLRDERVEAFTSVLPEGVYTYRYIAKATTPGIFIVPPTKAEEMYAPETFGRSASTKVVIQ